jgi:signal peptidase I
LRPGLHAFRKGEQVVRLKVQSGDHLFVDRLTYNFRKPTRGEIIVFETTGTPIPQQDTFYIKRLVGLGGECIQIGNDRHLIIDGRHLSASTAHFENVYSFDPKQPPEESQYSGHLNQLVADQYQKGRLAPKFPDESTKHDIPPDHYMVMGDNTVNSLDSRSWGEFSASKVIGKSYFVYWPITSRFGWGHR